MGESQGVPHLVGCSQFDLTVREQSIGLERMPGYEREIIDFEHRVPRAETQRVSRLAQPVVSQRTGPPNRYVHGFFRRGVSFDDSNRERGATPSQDSASRGALKATPTRGGLDVRLGNVHDQGLGVVGPAEESEGVFSRKFRTHVPDVSAGLVCGQGHGLPSRIVRSDVRVGARACHRGATYLDLCARGATKACTKAQSADEDDQNEKDACHVG